jgi:PAS domain S-box-containing protein
MSTFQFLLLEDKLQDTEAIQAVLTDGGIDCELLRVDTRAEFVRALKTAQFDLLLAAYAMPGFDGIAALETALNLRPETPFIFVSASLGEELAIEALKRGATDYVLKQRLERLVPCVQRALREAQERRSRQRAEVVLRQTSVELERQLQKLNAALSTITDFVFNFDRDGRFIYANQVLLDLWGLTTEEAIGKTMAQLNYPQAVERQLTENMQRVFETGKTVTAETLYTNPAGIDDYFEYILSPAFATNGTVEFVAGSSRNISERKAAEVERQQLLQQEQSARAVVEQANRHRDEFLAVSSHVSIYSPMTVRNQLLTALPYREYERLLPYWEYVSLDFKQVLYAPGEPIEYVYFPNSGIVSLVSIMSDSMVAEVAIVGNEGMAGLPVFLGVDTAPNQAIVQAPGNCLRMKAEVFKASVNSSDRLHRLLLRYTHALMVQTSQSVACKSHHSVQQRCCRWLLMTHDRVETNQFPITQQLLSQMMGVRRSSVTDVANFLKKAGLIRYHRGQVTIQDRLGLESVACECYRKVKVEFDRLAS